MAAPDSSHEEVEPFGQRGVRQFAGPFLVFCCSVGVLVGALMSLRSAAYYDSLSRVYDGKRVEIASAIDRLVVTVGRPRGSERDHDTWRYRGTSLLEMGDGWQPSWKKTLGIEWGRESWPQPWPEPNISHWRLRIKWRTIALVCLAPLVIGGLRLRLSRRGTTRQPEMTATPPM